MEVHYVEWHVTPFRRDRFIEAWRPALDRALAFGAGSCYLTRSIDDPLHFRQVSVWEDKTDFENYWASDKIATLREEALPLYHKPVLPNWHSLVAEAALDRSEA